MGGIVAITIRYSDGTEWRSSCWTNILPDGLWSPQFYNRDVSKAERHVRKWQAVVTSRRAAEPVLEKMYGNWNKLAPVEYGQVVVDFKTKTLISHQGYASPHKKYTFAGDDKYPAWAFRRVGAKVTMNLQAPKGARYFTVESFWKVNASLSATGATLKAIRALGFKIGAEERATWSAFRRGQTEILLAAVPHGFRRKVKKING